MLSLHSSEFRAYMPVQLGAILNDARAPASSSGVSVTYLSSRRPSRIAGIHLASEAR